MSELPGTFASRENPQQGNRKENYLTLFFLFFPRAVTTHSLLGQQNKEGEQDSVSFRVNNVFLLILLSPLFPSSSDSIYIPFLFLLNFPSSFPPSL